MLIESIASKNQKLKIVSNKLVKTIKIIYIILPKLKYTFIFKNIA